MLFEDSIAWKLYEDNNIKHISTIFYFIFCIQGPEIDNIEEINAQDMNSSVQIFSI